MAPSMPRRGFEPPRPCGHQPLKLARLPIPPPGQVCSGGESNPHGILLPQDPESCASANSATRASCSLAPPRDGFRERRPPPVRGGSVRRTESGADVPVSHGAVKDNGWIGPRKKPGERLEVTAKAA